MGMHHKGFTHNDVILGNIVSNNDGWATLIDHNCVMCVGAKGRSDYPSGLTLQNWCPIAFTGRWMTGMGLTRMGLTDGKQDGFQTEVHALGREYLQTKPNVMHGVSEEVAKNVGTTTNPDAAMDLMVNRNNERGRMTNVLRNKGFQEWRPPTRDRRSAGCRGSVAKPCRAGLGHDGSACRQDKKASARAGQACGHHKRGSGRSDGASASMGKSTIGVSSSIPARDLLSPPRSALWLNLKRPKRHGQSVL